MSSKTSMQINNAKFSQSNAAVNSRFSANESHVHFTDQEDDNLRELVKRHGTKKWHIISVKMQNKTPRECRKRWQTYLNMCMNKSTWSNDEDQILLEGHNTYGNRWTEIAKLVPGRTDNAVKNRYNALCKKLCQKSKVASTMGLNSLDTLAEYTIKDAKRVKTSSIWGPNREENGSSVPVSLMEFMQHGMSIDAPKSGEFVCLGGNKESNVTFTATVDTLFMQEVKDVGDCVSPPKDGYADMEEVMGWLTARTPTPDCEEGDRSIALFGSSPSIQKIRQPKHGSSTISLEIKQHESTKMCRAS